MLSRLFLISTLLLVGIITIAIGAPVAETIEVIKTVKIPQMGSGNLTLNRRLINGIPGLPQCAYGEYPGLVSSSCLDAKTIIAQCRGSSQDPPVKQFRSNCPERTTCMLYKTESDPFLTPETENFALCIDDASINSFNGATGGSCKTYNINGVTDGRGTISVDVYDINQNPIAVKTINFTIGTQVGSKENTPTLSRVVDFKSLYEVIKVCVELTVALEGWRAAVGVIRAVFGP